MEYTPRVDGIQVRGCVYLGPAPMYPIRYDVVKWEKHEPTIVTRLEDGQQYVSTESCYSIATLEWDECEECFNLNGVGMRLAAAAPSKAAFQMILDFAHRMTERIRSGESI